MEGGKIQCWANLTQDLLRLILNKLSLEEKLTLIPSICKLWKEAVMGSYYWQEIDIEEWCRHRRNQPELLDRMLRMLITRSSGSPRKLCVSNIPNDAIFSFIANLASSLQILKIPESKICDTIVEMVAGRMCCITYLDLSHCVNLGAPALEAFGNNCRLLSGLRRDMQNVGRFFCDEEARAIAKTMPELKQLELNNMGITTKGAIDILSGCPKLEFLDLRGCVDVVIDEKFVNEKCSGLKVLKHPYDGVPKDSLLWYLENKKRYEKRIAELLMKMGVDGAGAL